MYNVCQTIDIFQRVTVIVFYYC